MTQNQNRQRQGLLIALVALVALVGLLAGSFTRMLISSASPGQSQRPKPEPTATASPAPQLSPTAPSDPTVSTSLGHFTLKLTATPSAAHAGDDITINALATDNATGGPTPGLTCRLRAPSDGAPGLLSTWPSPTATNDAGIASWTATIPADAPGRYEIEVFAQTPSWSYVARTVVIVKAA